MDLFTQDREAWLTIENDIKAAAEQIGATVDFIRAKEGNELHPGKLKSNLWLI